MFKTNNMKYKFYILIIIITLLMISAVSAQENHTPTTLNTTANEKLEKTQFYNADNGKIYEDDTIITHNVVKYYGDNQTKFKVKVQDNNNKPAKNITVSFTKLFKPYKEKTTNKDGIVYFNINYKVGTHDVETLIKSPDGKSFWSTYNTVKIKSTIPTKELVKYSTSKKKFKIKFTDTKGKTLENQYIKLKIKGKTYKLKTNTKGIVNIKSTHFKTGNEKITAYNPVSGETRKIPVVVLKKGKHKINIRIDNPTVDLPVKKLKNTDRIYTVYETKHKQYDPGVYIICKSKEMEKQKHTKLLKAKYYFKNKNTGKIITKTSSKVTHNSIIIKPIKEYTPYKATVWYKDRK